MSDDELAHNYCYNGTSSNDVVSIFSSIAQMYSEGRRRGLDHVNRKSRQPAKDQEPFHGDCDTSHRETTAFTGHWFFLPGGRMDVVPSDVKALPGVRVD